MKKTHIILLVLGVLLLAACKNESIPSDIGSIVYQNSRKRMSGGPKTFGDSITSFATVDYCKLTNNEDSIDFGVGDNDYNKYMYDSNDLKRGMNGFKANFKYNPSIQLEEPLENPVVNITIQDLTTMLDTIKKRTAYKPDNYFSAIKVYYGLLNKKMVFICEPIALKQLQDNTTYCDTEGTGIFYIANANGFLSPPITRDSLDTLMKRYQDSVSITHYKRSFPLWWRVLKTDDRNFRPNYDYGFDDSRFCVMPLQQIVRVYRENLPKCENANPLDYVHFAIISNNYYTRKRLFTPGIVNYKVHIVAYTDNIRNANFDKSFNGLGADFGQMCPPNCGYVQIPAYFERQ